MLNHDARVAPVANAAASLVRKDQPGHCRRSWSIFTICYCRGRRSRGLNRPYRRSIADRMHELSRQLTKVADRQPGLQVSPTPSWAEGERSCPARFDRTDSAGQTRQWRQLTRRRDARYRGMPDLAGPAAVSGSSSSFRQSARGEESAAWSSGKEPGYRRVPVAQQTSFRSVVNTVAYIVVAGSAAEVQPLYQ